MGLLAFAVLCMAGIAAYVGMASKSDVDTAYASANSSVKERRNDLVRWTGQGVLASLAQQIGERRLDLIAGAQKMGGTPRAQQAASPKAAAAARQAALAALAESNAAAIYSARAVDSAGKVMAAWREGKADPLALRENLADDAMFARLKKDSSLLGQAVVAGYHPKVDLAAAEKKKRPPKPGKAAEPEIPAQGLMRVVVPLAGPSGTFDGLLEVNYRVESLFGLAPEAALEPLKRASKNAVLILLQGTGEEYYNSGGKAFTEDFSTVSPEYKKTLALMTAEARGGEELRYDTVINGKKDRPEGILAWQRIGYWNADIAGPEQLHVLAAFLPFADFKGAGEVDESGGNIFADPVFWALFLLLSGVLFAMGFVLVRGQLEPLRETAAAASHIDEFGGADEGLEFPEQSLKDLNSITMPRSRWNRSKSSMIDSPGLAVV
jgi:hypothetical protein